MTVDTLKRYTTYALLLAGVAGGMAWYMLAQGSTLMLICSTACTLTLLGYSGAFGYLTSKVVRPCGWGSIQQDPVDQPPTMSTALALVTEPTRSTAPRDAQAPVETTEPTVRPAATLPIGPQTTRAERFAREAFHVEMHARLGDYGGILAIDPLVGRTIRAHSDNKPYLELWMRWHPDRKAHNPHTEETRDRIMAHINTMITVFKQDYVEQDKRAIAIYDVIDREMQQQIHDYVFTKCCEKVNIQLSQHYPTEKRPMQASLQLGWWLIRQSVDALPESASVADRYHQAFDLAVRFLDTHPQLLDSTLVAMNQTNIEDRYNQKIDEALEEAKGMRAERDEQLVAAQAERQDLLREKKDLLKQMLEKQTRHRENCAKDRQERGKELVEEKQLREQQRAEDKRTHEQQRAEDKQIIQSLQTSMTQAASTHEQQRVEDKRTHEQQRAEAKAELADLKAMMQQILLQQTGQQPSTQPMVSAAAPVTDTATTVSTAALVHSSELIPPPVPEQNTDGEGMAEEEAQPTATQQGNNTEAFEAGR